MDVSPHSAEHQLPDLLWRGWTCPPQPAAALGSLSWEPVHELLLGPCFSSSLKVAMKAQQIPVFRVGLEEVAVTPAWAQQWESWFWKGYLRHAKETGYSWLVVAFLSDVMGLLQWNREMGMGLCISKEGQSMSRKRESLLLEGERATGTLYLPAGNVCWAVYKEPAYGRCWGCFILIYRSSPCLTNSSLWL